jgi:hypothetical protein
MLDTLHKTDNWNENARYPPQVNWQIRCNPLPNKKQNENARYAPQVN